MTLRPALDASPRTYCARYLSYHRLKHIELAAYTRKCVTDGSRVLALFKELRECTFRGCAELLGSAVVMHELFLRSGYIVTYQNRLNLYVRFVKSVQKSSSEMFNTRNCY